MRGDRVLYSLSCAGAKGPAGARSDRVRASRISSGGRCVETVYTAGIATNARPTGVSALEIEGLARRFGSRWALRGVSLVVEPGEVVALRGPNGSGKTTLLRVCATVLRPTRGSGRVFGHDLVEAPASVRPLIGLSGVATGLYDELTAEENLRFSMRMAGLTPVAEVIGATLRRVGLDAVKGESVRGYSTGMRRRLALARVMLRPPRLLLLDEPYASFDAEGVERVNDVVRDVRDRGDAVLIATHDLASGGGVIDRVLSLEAGRLVQTPPGPDGNSAWARPVRDRAPTTMGDAVSQ